MSQRNVGIVLPAYGLEAESIIEYVNSLKKELDPEALVISIDNPDQETIERLKNCSADLIVSERRRGKGKAIMEGFKYLEQDILVFADADGSVPAESVAKVISGLDGDASLSVGSRRSQESMEVIHISRGRKILGDILVRLANHSLPVRLTDYQCGVKAIEAGLWDQVGDSIELDGFAWDLELISEVARRQKKIIEVPVKWIDRPGSQLSISDSLPLFLKVIATEFYRNKIRR